VATDTLRRRITRGEAEARLVPRRRGPAYEVRLDSTSSLEPEPSQAVDTDLVALVDKLQAQNLELAGRVGFYPGRVTELEGRLKMLEAPKGAAVSTDSTSSPRRWWHRLRW
jgi:hypothetical protein